VSPQEHLRQAKTALDAIQPTAVTVGARKQFAELKRHLNALEKASASASGTAAGSASPSARGARGAKATSNANWGTEVAAMDKILTDLIGPDVTTGTGATTGTTGATGTSGTTRSEPATTVSLDEATRAKLMGVRTQIVAYAAAMSGASTAPKSEDAMPAGAPSASAAATQAGTPAAPTGSTSATPDAMPPAATPSATTPQMPGAQPPAATPPQPAATAPKQPLDPEAARRHLTAARDTLTQLTKLPAAAQLTGESRTQVGQLIANFNELITTPVEWRASYAKVAANLATLLGADTEAQQAAGTPPITAEATPPTDATPPAGATPPASATPGAVGTSGTATAVIDPAVREKLVEMRRHLKEFERASGGADAK
jgi:hypothetical protein